MSIDVLKDRLPEYARDLKLNLSSLASEELLSPQQKAGSFIAAALAANHAPTTQAVVDAFGPELTPEALNAAKIAASLMAMNNIYYRFVHLVHAADYKTLPAKLRMTAMAKPGVDKVDFELWSLVVSAFPPSRSRPRCASPRRSTPLPARSVRKRRWRRRWRRPPRVLRSSAGAKEEAL
jgi:alkyl hydroperoxide reductase subunit D